MPSILVTPPAQEPISLTEAKAHLRMVHNDEDALIASLITASRRHVEAQTGLVLIAQEWQILIDEWPLAGTVDLATAPLLSVDEVAIFGEEDDKAVVDPAHYYADLASRPPRLMLRGSRLWPAPARAGNGIGITVTAGFGISGDNVPSELRQAILLLVAHWYEHRGNAKPPALPLTLGALLAHFREVRL